MTLGDFESRIQTAASEHGIRVSVLHSGDALLVHASGTCREAHQLAKTLPLLSVFDTFTDGWGRLVTNGRVKS